MKIERLRINHLENPMGYALDTVTASYWVSEAGGKRQTFGRICVYGDEACSALLYDTGKSEEVKGCGTRLPLSLQPCTRYYWKVFAWDDAGDMGESRTAWFETGRMELAWEGEPITAPLEEGLPVLEKEFTLKEGVRSARLYICGLGIFEAYLNGRRVGEEIFTPYLTSYESHIQYLTFDTGEYLKQGKNRLEVCLAPGWYMGSYGYRQNPDRTVGRRLSLWLNLDIRKTNGEKRTIATDLSWKYRPSQILYSDIYNGELRDDTRRMPPAKGCERAKGITAQKLQPRRSVPVTVMEVLKPAALLHTPAGETVLDMGQNMTGRITFCCRGKRGQKYVFSHGEILQGGNFYRGNYRTAKAEYIYISDGAVKTVFPGFTFYGFRYVKITDGEGNPATGLSLEDFTGQVLTSQIERTGFLETGNPKLNQLISNIFWSWRDNFLDVPTDCPQRDERLGWTGDAQIFGETACLNGECYEFFRKYLYDIRMEQQKHHGAVPQIVPSVDRRLRTSAGWGDAAVILPWTLYRVYGDQSILQEQWESMKAWVGYIDWCNERAGTNPDLWQNGFHYGDWLAPDGGCYHMPVGGTEVYYISSVWFYGAVRILAEAAKVLGKQPEAEAYEKKAEGIKRALLREYFTGSGKLCMDTQTGYVLALQFGLYESREQKEGLAQRLCDRIRKDGYRIRTGFVGTPFLLPVLAEAGLEKLALRLLLQEEDPGWLYQVKLGATTVWERWDSVKADGSMSDTGMNSLNHYANGSVLQWMYEGLGGIRRLGESGGYEQAVIHPLISERIGRVKAALDTSAGRYEVVWELAGAKELYLKCRIPFGCEAKIILPWPDREAQERYGSCVEVGGGVYEFRYTMTEEFQDKPSMEDSVRELMKQPDIREYLVEKAPMLAKTEGAEIQHMTLEEMSALPFFLGIGTNIGLDEKTLGEIAEFLRLRK